MEVTKKATAELYLFELVERTSRFYIHLDQINRQFYAGGDNKVADKLIFVQSYKDCLLNLLSVSSGIHSILNREDLSLADIDKCIQHTQEAFRSINLLHQEYLNHLPRPSEPIELRRFSRIIDKHVVKLNEEKSASAKQQISIYVSEALGDAVYAKDPLTKFQNTSMQACLLKFKEDFNTVTIPFEKQSPRGTDDALHHITIPRIDTHNPCRWPTMIHELGHKIIHEDFFKRENIENDFLDQLTVEQQDFVKAFVAEREINLLSWLRECWCDLFACVVFGPAFWFSQYLSFIFETGQNEDIKYPKPLFRIRLIYNILAHRFSRALFKEMKETMSVCESVLEHFDQTDEKGYTADVDVREIFMYFREFFRNYFSKSAESDLQFGTPDLNAKLGPLIKYTEEIHESTIRNLETCLAEDLPIPSYAVAADKLIQRPTYVQEILAAAWYYRNNHLKTNVLKDLDVLFQSTPEEFGHNYEQGVLKLFNRFDQSILRSIQVSEWFDLFYETEQEPELLALETALAGALTTDDILAHQLADIDIYRILKSGDLKIIPVMNLKEQLGSASFDLRLGTSFQLYFQNKYGVIDFSDEDSLANAEFNSNLIDLDFLESITISPGQFILGHTMEYIKLPEMIAAEIEGRSSFARLGLEIHMTAGFIDPGFEGVVTLEIHNAGPNPIKLFPGVRIAQLKFIPVSRPYNPYNKRHAAKYKGLLSHHTSMQFKDYEIAKIKKAIRAKD